MGGGGKNEKRDGPENEGKVVGEILGEILGTDPKTKRWRVEKEVWGWV